MDSWLIFITIIHGCLISVSQSEPSQSVRRCGEDLANILALVCKDRGYNSFFPRDGDQTFNRRNKRGLGIVDECCKSSCSLSTLLEYCGPLTTESPVNTQIRKRSDSDKDWDLDTKPVGGEVLTFKLKSPDPVEGFRSHLYGNGYDQRQTHQNDVTSNSITKKSHDEKSSSREKTETGFRVYQLYGELSNNGPVKSKEEKKLVNSKEKSGKCNLILGCKINSGRSKEVSGIDRRDVARSSIRSSSSERLSSKERSSDEPNRIRHSHHDKNHRNSSRERKTTVDDRPKQSQVGTISPYYSQKGLVFHPNVKTRLNIRQDQ